MTATHGYNKMLELMGTDALEWADSNGWTVMLLDNAYIFDATHEFIDDVSAHQVTGTGYTAGGQVLTGVSESFVDPWRVFTCDTPAWATSTITAQFAVFYKNTGTPATSPLLMIIDAEGDVVSTATTFSVPIDINGLFRTGFTAP